MAETTDTIQAPLQTAPTASTQEQRASKRRIGTSGIQQLKDQIEYIKPFELSSSQRLITYERMMLDPDVSTPYNKTKEMVEQAFSSYEIKYNKHSEASKQARDFMKWCIESNFNTTTSPRSVASHAYSFAKNKLAVFEKEYDRVSTGDWEGYYALSGLYPVALSTLDSVNPFKIDDLGRKLSYARQRITAFKENLRLPINNYPKTDDGLVNIPIAKLAMFTDSPDPINPFGISVFDHIYEEWRFKTLVKEILLTGVAKDLAGTPIFYVPSIIMEEAEADPNSWQAKFLTDLDNQAANLHTGDQTYIRLPSDPHEGASSLREFEVKFLGIEGSGKGFDLVAILEQSKKAIYNAFGAANLLAGENGGGSYNLIEGQNSNHAFTVKRNVTVIEEVWNKQIWPQLFRLNEWKLSPDDMPKFKAGNVSPVSMEELGKFIQRVGTSGYLPVVPEVINHILSSAGMPYQVPEGMSTEELKSILSDNTSNAGEGNGTSGTGSSQTNGDNNMDNVA